MVHEVMILDHGGRELAALHAAAALKAYVAISVIATLLDPLARVDAPVVGAIVHVGLCVGIAIAIGLFEAIATRLRLRIVPSYLLSASVAAAIALLTVLWRLA
jgi:formate hydrogenlyase subunit 4